jgi:hypothetical protein
MWAPHNRAAYFHGISERRSRCRVTRFVTSLAERFPDAAWLSQMKHSTPIAPKGTIAEARRQLHDLDAVPALSWPEHASLITSRDLNDHSPPKAPRFDAVDRPTRLGSSTPTDSIVRAVNANTKQSDIRQPGNRRMSIQSSRPDSKSSVLTRPLFTWLGGGAMFVLSFFIAMSLINPAKPPNPGVAIMAASVVSDPRTLMAAVKAAGLKGTANVKGSIDEIKRLDNNRVTVKGWAAEMTNAGASLTVMVFVGGRHKLTMETTGPHADAIHALGLSDAPLATNVSFEGTLACDRGQKLIVVAVADSNVYSHFGSRVCP